MALSEARSKTFDIYNLLMEKQLDVRELEVLLKALTAETRDHSQRWLAELLYQVCLINKIIQDSARQDVQDQIEALFNGVKKCVNADYVQIYVPDPESGILTTGLVKEEEDSRSALRIDLANMALAQQKMIVVPQARNVQKSILQKDNSEIICANIPLIGHHGRGLAVLQTLRNDSDPHFSSDDLAFLQVISKQATGLIRYFLQEKIVSELEIKNAELQSKHTILENNISDLQEKINLIEIKKEKLLNKNEKIIERELIIQNLIVNISKELNIEIVIDNIIQHIEKFLNVKRCNFFIYKEESGLLVNNSNNEEGISFSLNENSITISSFKEKNIVIENNVKENNKFNSEIDATFEFKTESILCAPIISKDSSVIGILQCLNKKNNNFDNEDINLIRYFSSCISIFQDNVNQFHVLINEKNNTESILRSLSNSVFILDMDNKVKRLNRATTQLFKLNSKKSVGKPISEVIQDRNNWLPDAIEKAHELKKGQLNVDKDFFIDNKEVVSVNVMIEPMIDIDDKIIGTMLIAEDITQEKRAKATMSHFMPKEVVERLLNDNQMVLGGTSQEVSILFSDIRKFTTISEKIGARETVLMLNEYFTEMVDVIFSHHGVLDKYIGDAIMALFGAPFGTPLDANNAVAAANHMMKILQKINIKRKNNNMDIINIGIGIATGEVICGNIGSAKRMDYTVIGDPVNLASRLEGATKQYGIDIIINESTMHGLTDDKKVRELDFIRVKGKEKPVSVYQALDFYTEETFPNMDHVVKFFEQGLYQYRKQKWQNAIDLFTEALSLHPADVPAQLFLKRTQHCLNVPPPEDWDGVWRLTEK